MHPYCAVKLNIIKLGCAQGEGKEMGVVRDICSAQSSSPCSGRGIWSVSEEGEGVPPSTAPSSCAWGEASPCPWTCLESAWILQASLWELLLLFPLCSAFLCFVLSYFFSSKNIHEDAVGLFGSVTPGRCVQQARQLLFVPHFFLPCGAYSDSAEGEQGISYFKISSADFEKLSLNIL